MTIQQLARVSCVDIRFGMISNLIFYELCLLFVLRKCKQKFLFNSQRQYVCKQKIRKSKLNKRVVNSIKYTIKKGKDFSYSRGRENQTKGFCDISTLKI